MKKYLPFALAYTLALALFVFALSSCSAKDLSPEKQKEIAELEKEADQADQELELAIKLGDPEAIVKARAHQDEIEAKIDKLYQQGAAENVHSFFSFFGIPGAGLVAPLAYLAFRRPRQHLVRIFKGLIPGRDKSLSWRDSLRSVLSLIGLAHSSEVTDVAFDPKAPAKIDAAPMSAVKSIEKVTEAVGAEVVVAGGAA